MRQVTNLLAALRRVNSFAVSRFCAARSALDNNATIRRATAAVATIVICGLVVSAYGIGRAHGRPIPVYMVPPGVKPAAQKKPCGGCAAAKRRAAAKAKGALTPAPDPKFSESAKEG